MGCSNSNKIATLEESWLRQNFGKSLTFLWFLGPLDNGTSFCLVSKSGSHSSFWASPPRQSGDALVGTPPNFGWPPSFLPDLQLWHLETRSGHYKTLPFLPKSQGSHTFCKVGTGPLGHRMPWDCNLGKIMTVPKCPPNFPCTGVCRPSRSQDKLLGACKSWQSCLLLDISTKPVVGCSNGML